MMIFNSFTVANDYNFPSHTATLIDNIFSNHVEHSYLRSGLLMTDISDHLPIFSISLDHNCVPIKAKKVYLFVTKASKIYPAS